MSQKTLDPDVSPFYQQVQNEFGKTKSAVVKYVEIILKWSQEEGRHPEPPRE